MYNFSIIIPHKNIPDLLLRCLQSIPQRNDLEIIIVDDNSDSDKVDFTNFPGKNRPDSKIIFSKGKKGRGPGFARNIGISAAIGKWIIFSDSDDYFTESFNSILDNYKNAEEEVIFFKCCRQNESGKVTEEYPLFNYAIDEAVKKNNTDAIVYGVPSPVAKFIKLDFLKKNAIRYQEITGGDDILFSVRMAINLTKFSFSDSRIYCVVDRPGSLTRNNNWRSFYSYSDACLHAYKLLKTVSKEKLALAWLISWWGFLWAENKFAASSLVPRFFYTMGWRNAGRTIKKGMKRGAWKWKQS